MAGTSRIDLEDRQRVEIEFWRDSPTQRPDSDSIENLINKAGDAGILLDLLRVYRKEFKRARDILELGGGQGWASCLVKRRFPQARVTLTDISEHAIASVEKWERIFQVRIDGAAACRSYQIAAADSSFDLVFCFASAHHFGAHRRTLRDMARVLRPGGTGLYLYEPSCRPFAHRLARRRVNRKRPDVPEDVLIHPKIVKLASEAGLECQVHFYPSVQKRRKAGALLYYSILSRLPFLVPILPCTANFRFEKPAATKPA